ncbi:unnamed protein product, partial [Symbiodinium sp. KB8]
VSHVVPVFSELLVASTMRLERAGIVQLQLPCLGQWSNSSSAYRGHHGVSAEDLARCCRVRGACSPEDGSANGHRAEPPTSWPGALWMHVMKVFSGAKPEFDPILMLQMYSFRM